MSDVRTCAVLGLVAFASVSGLAALQARSQENVSADIVRGFGYAEQRCASCHAVASGVYASPVAEAPSFQEIAETPGITSRALTVSLITRRPNQTMPAIVLDRYEREDIIAYILSLRGG